MLCITLVGYTYIVYPLILIIWSSSKQNKIVYDAADKLPFVSVVISVYNEEEHIEERINNLKSLNYPPDLIEILIGSDGSDDATNEKLKSLTDVRIKTRFFQVRRGKAAVLNDLISEAKGEIIVLSDANTFYERSTVHSLVRPFYDATVGAVCGELLLHSDLKTVGSVGEASYWNYENIIKLYESRIQTTLGGTGAVYAIRKTLFNLLPTNKMVADDFLIPMNIIKRGFRNYYEPKAVAYENLSNSVSGEFKRKVRISTGNFYGISEFSELLHPKYGFVAFALWSHKIIRWSVPFLLILIFLLNIILSFTSPFMSVILLLQLAFYASSVLGFILDSMKLKAGLLGLPYYFVAMNAALFVGFFKFLFSNQRPTWEVVR